MSQKVIAIVGPTAVGKTSLSLKIAKNFSGEIISGDSMQIYRGMNIGTDKISPDEMQGISHHMLDIKDPDESFSVADFQQYVRQHITNIQAKNKLPMIVGGTGLYIQAVLYNFTFDDRKRDEQFTKELELKVEREGVNSIYEELQQIDPKQAKKIHPNNYRRVIRALEIYHTTGKTMSEHHALQQSEPLYNYKIIGLTMEREYLYEQINARVDEMVDEGLLEEVEHLYEKGYKNCQSMRGIGYKEIIPYLEGEATLDECIEQLKRNTRRYAKRQFTWFENKMNVHWYRMDPEHRDESIERIITNVKGFTKSIANNSSI